MQTIIVDNAPHEGEARREYEDGEKEDDEEEGLDEVAGGRHRW